MSRLIKFIWFLPLLAGLLVACAAPATSAPTPAQAQSTPTTQPEPTQSAPTATSIPTIPSEQVAISVPADNESFNATVTGNGEIAVIIANTNDSSRWQPLVDILSQNKNLRIMNFAYRDEAIDTSNVDTRQYLIIYGLMA